MLRYSFVLQTAILFIISAFRARFGKVLNRALITMCGEKVYCLICSLFFSHFLTLFAWMSLVCQSMPFLQNCQASYQVQPLLSLDFEMLLKLGLKVHWLISKSILFFFPSSNNCSRFFFKSKFSTLNKDTSSYNLQKIELRCFFLVQRKSEGLLLCFVEMFYIEELSRYLRWVLYSWRFVKMNEVKFKSEGWLKCILESNEKSLLQRCLPSLRQFLSIYNISLIEESVS